MSHQEGRPEQLFVVEAVFDLAGSGVVLAPDPSDSRVPPIGSTVETPSSRWNLAPRVGARYPPANSESPRYFSNRSWTDCSGRRCSRRNRGVVNAPGGAVDVGKGRVNGFMRFEPFSRKSAPCGVNQTATTVRTARMCRVRKGSGYG